MDFSVGVLSFADEKSEHFSKKGQEINRFLSSLYRIASVNCIEEVIHRTLSRLGAGRICTVAMRVQEVGSGVAKDIGISRVFGRHWVRPSCFSKQLEVHCHALSDSRR